MGNKVQFKRPNVYKFLYAYISKAHRLYYKRLTIVGYEKIPEDTPVIFAVNHQNALMDALAVLFAARRPVVFLTRAYIFKKPLLANILNSLMMLPIYRIRDGVDSLNRNQEIFDNTVEVLKSNIPICILPEGNHEGRKRLRPLKKGIFRIAFQAEESILSGMGLQIVPVGLDYSDYFDPGADLTVVFGTPIKIADYMEGYHLNEQKTINALMNVLAESMRSVMINIPQENYQLIDKISEMYEPNVWDTCNVKRQPFNKLTIQQYIIQKITEAFALHPARALELDALMTAYHTNLRKYNLDDSLLQQRQPRVVTLTIEALLTLVLFPLHLYGIIMNLIPMKVPLWLAAKIKDQHFKSSVNFGIGVLLFPVYYLIAISIFCLLTDGYLLKLVFGVTLPLTGLFAFYSHLHFLKLKKKIRLLRFKLLSKDTYNTLLIERDKLIEQIKNTINT